LARESEADVVIAELAGKELSEQEMEAAFDQLDALLDDMADS
jgi:hypothetical protein